MNLFQKNFFPKKYRPRKLPIREMWKLYNLLGAGMGKNYLLDEIVALLQTVPPEKIKMSLEIMYGSVSISNPQDVGILFTRGLQRVYFFEFQDFIKVLHGP